MIEKMKKYTFLVFYKEYEQFLLQLRELGVVHVNCKVEGVLDNEQLEKKIALADKLQKALAKVEKYAGDRVSAETDNGAKRTEITDIEIEELLEKLSSLEAEEQQIVERMTQLKREIDRMRPWGEFSAEKIEKLKQEGWKLRYFTCSEKQYDKEWETLYNTFVVGKEGSQLYFVAVNKTVEAYDLDAQEVELNKQDVRMLSAELDGLSGLLAAKRASIEAWAIANLSKLQVARKHVLSQIDWQKITLSTTALVEDKLCLLEGFCPVENETNLNKMLDEKHIYYSVAEPKEEDNAPVKLKNNWFTKMFECLTGMYGWPVYGEFDPTPILGPFFLLFFALCMGDAGYGILLILFGILTTKKKINIEMFEGLGPLITTLGIGTLVIGFFLGTFFGIDLYTASWVPESLKSVMIKGKVAGYDIQMVMALCIGVFHICLAMTIKAICYTKRFGFKQNISTWGWLFLILGALVTIVLGLTEVFSPEVTKWVLIAVGCISGLGIYIFNTPGRNPLINIGAGLWDTYNMATGILGDVLSYIRLYALGLAGGMLGAAFNSLGVMVLGDNPTWQWLFFILILLIGHLLNLCMSALGAFVHPLRLSFVEYFKNSGYEGKGHLYEPFRNE